MLEYLVYGLMIWIIPIGIGIFFSVGAWIATKNLSIWFSAPLCALPIAFTVTPVWGGRLIPIPASMFVLFGWIPPDVSSQDYLKTYLPIGVGWIILTPVVFLIRAYINKIAKRA